MEQGELEQRDRKAEPDEVSTRRGVEVRRTGCEEEEGCWDSAGLTSGERKKEMS